MTDPIADMLTRIRNAMAVKKPEVVLPFSRIKLEIAEILKTNGYVSQVKKVEKGEDGNTHAQINIGLKYIGGKEPAISKLSRVSKPGLRVYAKKDNLPVVLNNIGIAIISTSQGLMTNKEAKKKHLGGEVICEIY
jgi:small subunit ribosomal protein S8